METITTIDDAAAFGTEALHRLLRRQCQADDVDFQLPPQFGFCDRSEGSELIGAGVVDKHIMAPESTHGLRKQTLDVRALQHDPRPARNISSTASTNNEPATVVYSATKSAVDAITRALARELGPKKIRVNAINPGATDTEGYQRMGLVGSAFGTIARTSLGRLGHPRDIVAAAVFLASDEAAWITGESIRVSGGLR